MQRKLLGKFAKLLAGGDSNSKDMATQFIKVLRDEAVVKDIAVPSEAPVQPEGDAAAAAAEAPEAEAAAEEEAEAAAA